MEMSFKNIEGFNWYRFCQSYDGHWEYVRLGDKIRLFRRCCNDNSPFGSGDYEVRIYYHTLLMLGGNYRLVPVNGDFKPNTLEVCGWEDVTEFFSKKDITKLFKNHSKIAEQVEKERLTKLKAECQRLTKEFLAIVDQTA